jgi:myo-inositol-1(or 4)-monophosphatase
MSTNHVEIAADVAREAGMFLKKNFGSIDSIERKADRSLVTNLDRAAEEIIARRLRAEFPGYRILGEESGLSAAQGEYTWVIDPLDGTHNYIRRIPVYGVSIGLMRGREYLVGVIYMPSEDHLYAAEKGGGAWKNGSPMSVTRCSLLSEASVAFDSDFKTEPDRKTRVMKELAAEAFNVRISGSSARNLTFLAEGSVDIVVEFDDRIWDFTAGVTIVREAGGKFTDHGGGEPATDRGRYLATNGILHERVIPILGKNS